MDTEQAKAKLANIHKEAKIKAFSVLRELVGPVFEKAEKENIPLETLRWSQEPRYNDERYVFDIDTFYFNEDQSEEFDALYEIAYKVFENDGTQDRELLRLLEKVVGNATITISRDGVIFEPIADDEDWY